MKKVKMKKNRIQTQLQRALMRIVRWKIETHPTLMLILSLYRKGIQRKRLTRMIDNYSNKKLKFPKIRDNNRNSMILKYSKSNSHSHQSHPWTTCRIDNQHKIWGKRIDRMKKVTNISRNRNTCWKTLSEVRGRLRTISSKSVRCYRKSRSIQARQSMPIMKV